MKQVWVKVDPWDKEQVTAALESGADAVIVPDGRVEEVRDLGLITTISGDGDLRWDQEVAQVEISSAADEEKIVNMSRQMKVIVHTSDWTIIPLENLVARSDNIFVPVKDLQEAETALAILEKGVAGIVIEGARPPEIMEIVNGVKSGHEILPLEEFKIESITPKGLGHRVCVDTCSLMAKGEGLLVGNSSSALFLIHSESIENPYVSPRPFRVNAGAVHAYVMVPGGKTKYLCELKAGDQVLGVNEKGESFTLVVGRVKTEKRPLLLIEATGTNGRVTALLQNAETIRLVGPQGEPMSVVKLQRGDKVLGYVEEGGRHFGHRVKETISEK